MVRATPTGTIAALPRLAKRGRREEGRGGGGVKERGKVGEGMLEK